MVRWQLVEYECEIKCKIIYHKHLMLRDECSVCGVAVGWSWDVIIPRILYAQRLQFRKALYFYAIEIVVSFESCFWCQTCINYLTETGGGHLM